MIQRHILHLIFGITLLLSSFATGCATAAENPSEASTLPKIIAVGDIHGDFEAYEIILTEAKLIDSQSNWIAGDTIFVQTGDIPDRGPDTKRILEHLQKIQKQARKAGGEVVTLIGNHEAMNMTGDLRYVHPGEYAAFEGKKSEKTRDKIYAAKQKEIEAFYRQSDSTLTAEAIKEKWLSIMPLGRIEHQKSWSPRGTIGKWITKNKAVTLIQGNLFAHGGFSEKYTAYSLEDMNKAAKIALKKQDTSDESIINDPLGPLWYRGLVKREANDTHPGQTTLSREEELNLVLSHYGASRVIVGHSRNEAGIKASFDTKLIQIDTGASAHYGGTRSFLRIEGESVYAHDNGIVTQLK